MKYSHWLAVLFIFSVILCSPYIYITGYNYVIDPLWNFKHSNEYNQYQVPFNERQQKTNLYTFDSTIYDGLIVGTSRSTYINQHNFKNANVFNYSTSAMHIREYNDYIEYAKLKRGEEFNVIYLEVFPNQISFPVTFEEPEVYINLANSPFYRVKSLFSFDTYEKSKANYELVVEPNNIGSRSYNRDNIAIAKVLNEEEVENTLAEQMKKIVVETEYTYSTEYKELLREIRENNPNTQFVLYSPPYFKERFFKLFKGDVGYQIYESWLQDCIEVFGEVNNFLYVNAVSEDLSNYFDSNHFYPKVGDRISAKLEGSEEYINEDFGVIVNKGNLNDHLNMIKHQLHHLE